MRDRSVRRPSTVTSTPAQRCAEVQRWRTRSREASLHALANSTRGLSWTPRLWRALLDELHVSDAFQALVPRSRSLSPSLYPQAVAIALAERHSWAPADLRRLARRLGLSAHPRRRSTRPSPSGPRASR
jgi:hypothetical protein